MGRKNVSGDYPVKRVKLPSLRQLRNKADKLWSTLILLLATPEGSLDAVCGVCKKEKAISAHHVFHKSMHGRFRYDRRNGIPICRKCHFMERRDPAPVVISARWYVEGFDVLAIEVMAARGNGPFVRKRKDYELVIAGLEEMIAKEVLPNADASAAVEL